MGVVFGAQGVVLGVLLETLGTAGTLQRISSQNCIIHQCILTICLLIHQRQNKCVAESNNLLRLHRLLDPASHCTNYGSDLLDPTSHCTNYGSDLLDPATYMHFTIYLHRGTKSPLSN